MKLALVAWLSWTLGLVGGCNVARGGSLQPSDRTDPSMSAIDATDASTDGSIATPPSQSDASAGLGEDAGMTPIGSDSRDVVIGYYAERRAFRTIQKVTSAIFDDEVKVLTTSYSLVQILRQGSRYVFRENACRVEIANEGNFVSLEVTIEDRVPQSIPQIESEILVEDAAGAITWVRPLTSAPVGFVPQGPSDTLPTDAKDPRVRDSEGDGQPGVTAHVKGRVTFVSAVDGDLYLTQWNRARYAGTRQADGTLDGENFDTSEQNVIGSNDPTLAENNPPIVPDENTADNRIVLVPLAAPITCATLLTELDSLFK